MSPARIARLREVARTGTTAEVRQALEEVCNDAEARSAWVRTTPNREEPRRGMVRDGAGLITALFGGRNR